ncbi:MAG: FtsX-like permease family protein [Pseudomonadales bacterium]|nr:FtsX-like permease family protein [Pseudomonadales bacterium]
MSIVSLMWANLFRKPTRTSLTLASVTVAFLLFMLLRSISAAFDSGIAVTATDRLMVMPKYSQVDSLPFAQKQQILRIEGVDGIAHTSWFGGTYQDPKNFFAKYPVDPLSYFDVYSELDLEPADALERFTRERTAAVVDVGLMQDYGWEIGDVIPIQGTIYAKTDGSRLWEFEIVGQFTEKGESSSFPLFLFHYEYFKEAASFGGDAVGNWIIRPSSAERADAIAQEIDALFENSADPTKTASEEEYNRQFARQLGDMGFITTMIMSAVFFTIVLLTGNTMTQALRERIPELAVLKTLGFQDGTVSLMVLGEAILLCLVGGVLGVALAFLIGPGLVTALEGIFGSFEVNLTTALEALVLSVLIGTVIGIIPAVSAQRLAIVDALRK